MPLHIREKLGKAPVILSPMAGYSDSPYRQICRELGSAASITEFVSTDALDRNSAKSIAMFRFQEQERPIVFQIFGNDPNVILRAIEKILPLQPDALDLNMGCSVRKVAHKGSGAGLLREPQKAQKILQRMVQETSLPVSAKIRLGWDKQNMNYLDMGKRIEDAGAWAVFVHGRTKSQGYTGKASWEEVATLKQNLSIAVFGNGDIESKEMALEYQHQYGLDGILIGRAAIGNPWIFSGRDRSGLSFSQRLPLILKHLFFMKDFYGEQQATILFRKHLGKYLKGIANSAIFKNEVLHIEQCSQMETALKSFEKEVVGLY